MNEQLQLGQTFEATLNILVRLYGSDHLLQLRHGQLLFKGIEQSTVFALEDGRWVVLEQNDLANLTLRTDKQ